MSLPGTHPLSAMHNPDHPFHTGKPYSQELLDAEREYELEQELLAAGPPIIGDQLAAMLFMLVYGFVLGVLVTLALVLLWP